MAYVIVSRLLRLNRLKFVDEFDEPFELLDQFCSMEIGVSILKFNFSFAL